MQRCLWCVAVLWAGCGPVPEPSGSSSGTQTSDVADWPEAWAEFEAEVLSLVNIKRGALNACGGEPQSSQPPLAMSPALTVIARGHSEDMAERNFFDHVNPDGLDVEDRLIEADYSGAYPWGENIAAGYTSASQVVDGWMTSPGHCRNIMHGDYGVIGIGYYGEGADGPMWTQVFAGSD